MIHWGSAESEGAMDWDNPALFIIATALSYATAVIAVMVVYWLLWG